MPVHVPVLLDQAIFALAPRPDATFLDCTAGGGGHAERLLDAGARVVALDVDPGAVAAVASRLARFGDRVRVVRASFADARQVLDDSGVAAVDGLVADLGLGSHQLDDPSRGFSFSLDGPLDMRMARQGETAAEAIARLDEPALAQALRDFGEERFARRIARAAKAASQPPRTTRELASLVSSAIPRKAWPREIHPATRTFQALRILVNRELLSLDALLAALPALLAPGGRAAILSFHSLEDRRVKVAFRDLAGRCRCPPRFPVCACGAKGDFDIVTKKPIAAGEPETRSNPRARSARLRVLERNR